jgi:hypothetical protein
VAASSPTQPATAAPNSSRRHHTPTTKSKPPDADDFAIAVAKKLNEGKGELWKAGELWQLVYNQGRHLRLS